MQTIIAVMPDAYERMFRRLTGGEDMVKTFRNYCPHTNPADCKCVFYENILVNGEIMRRVDGELVKIHNYADLMKKST
jgi:hypothetical protein